MPSSNTNTVELAILLAGLILPAWPIWRIQSRRVSLPISFLLSCWFLVALAVIPMWLDPRYDSFGVGMGMFFSPALAWGYTLLLSAIRAGMGQPPSTGFGRRDTTTGLIVWSGLCVFGFVYPFVMLPLARKDDLLLLYGYLFFCGPVLSLAMVMSVTYLFRLRRLEPWEA